MTQQHETIELTLRKLVSEHIASGPPPETISLDSSLVELGLDSFEFMRFMLDVEGIFGITVSDEDWFTKRMNTLQDIIDLVAGLQITS